MSTPSLPRPIILDLGCGEGIKIQRFNPSGTYVGVDLDLESVMRIRGKKSDGLAIIAKAEQLPFPSDVFDEVHAYDVLEHVQDFDASCSEIARCLRKNGTVVIEVPYHESEITLLKANSNYWKEIGHMRTVQMRALQERLSEFRVRRVQKKRGIQHLLLSFYFRHGGHIISERGRCSNASLRAERLLGVLDEDYFEVFIGQKHSLFVWLFVPVLFCAYLCGKVISLIVPKTLRVEFVKN